MAKNKTRETEVSVGDFVNALKVETKRSDSLRLIELIKKVAQLEPKMWGTSIIGFGSHHFRYESGHEGDAPMVSFSPRAAALTLYLPAFESRGALLETLGKHKASKGCLYIAKLEDVDLAVLKDLIRNHLKEIASGH